MEETVKEKSQYTLKLQAFETTDYVFVIYGTEEIPEDHNCDYNGCSSLYHVKYHFRKDSSLTKSK